MASDRYSRNIGLFSIEGQRRIASTKVTVIGLGGLGSAVVQQLAYLGVEDYGLVDFDIVTDSSLNRLIGAVESDVAAQTKKIAVAERLITGIKPTARVRSLDAHVSDPAVEALIRGSDVVFGCLDRDLPRLQLVDLCTRFARPLFDLASDVGEDDGKLWYGGRVVLCDGNRCLVCLGMLDQQEMAQDSMSPEQRDQHARIYGVPKSNLADTGPMVVSVNGAVASIAVTEFMALSTGLRTPMPYLKYLADRQLVRSVGDEPEADCFYCKGRWGAST